MAKIQLPNKQNLELILGLFILVVIGFFFFKMAGGLILKTNKLQTEINQCSQDLNKATSLSIVRKTLEAEIKELTPMVSYIEGRIFAGNEKIIVNLNSFAQETKISIKSIDPLEERTQIEVFSRPDAALRLLPFRLKFKCDFFELMQLLNKIEKAEKIFVVDEVKIDTDSREIWNHDIQILLKVPVWMYRKN